MGQAVWRRKRNKKCIIAVDCLVNSRPTDDKLQTAFGYHFQLCSCYDYRPSCLTKFFFKNVLNMSLDIMAALHSTTGKEDRVFILLLCAENGQIAPNVLLIDKRQQNNDMKSVSCLCLLFSFTCGLWNVCFSLLFGCAVSQNNRVMHLKTRAACAFHSK